MGWQKASGYNKRARAEATIGRFKRVIGDGLRSRTDERRATEMDVGRPGPEPHAGAGTPRVRPHRLTLDGAGVIAPTPLIRATSVDAPFRARGNFRTVVARGRML